MKTRIGGAIGLAALAFLAGFAAAPAGFNRDRAVAELSHLVTVHAGLQPFVNEWNDRRQAAIKDDKAEERKLADDRLQGLLATRLVIERRIYEVSADFLPLWKSHPDNDANRQAKAAEAAAFEFDGSSPRRTHAEVLKDGNGHDWLALSPADRLDVCRVFASKVNGGKYAAETYRTFLNGAYGDGSNELAMSLRIAEMAAAGSMMMDAEEQKQK